MKTRLILLILLVIIALSVAGCTTPGPVITPEVNTPLPSAQTPSPTTVQTPPSATPTPTSSPVPTQNASPSAPAPTTATVTISGFAFKPENVTIAQGGTVSWTNDEDAVHTIKFSDSESPRLPKDVTYNKRFDSPGSYEYHCGIHPFMTGRVIVV